MVETPAGQRLDKYLTQVMEGYSRTQLQQFIKGGQVTVGGQVARSSMHLQGGEVITIILPETEQGPPTVKPEKLDLEVLYEDQDLVVINKAAGLVVHPGKGNPQGTLVNGLVFRFRELSDINGALRPGIVHRLDRDTSGVIVIAKNNRAHISLARQFEQRLVRKVYLGITWGQWIPESGEIRIGIGRMRSQPTRYEAVESGKPALTHYRVLASSRYLSYVEFRPVTGRTHQIRVHCLYAGHPLFADEVYHGGSARIKGYLPEVQQKLLQSCHQIGRHALHAYQLEIVHPQNNRTLVFKAPLPPDMQALRATLAMFDG